jgi:hypothetical protein
MATWAARIRSRIAHLTFLMMRPMTLGVRGVVIDGDESVLLVRHGYVSGWHFPGGGVEVGETCLDSLRRELEEEACVTLRGEPVLHGLFFNESPSRRDHFATSPCSASAGRTGRSRRRDSSLFPRCRTERQKAHAPGLPRFSMQRRSGPVGKAGCDRACRISAAISPQ